MNTMYTLYGTEHCHLCEEAAALLQAQDTAFQTIDIAEDDCLLERYGNRIPVLATDRGELAWPFTVEDVLRLLGKG